MNMRIHCKFVLLVACGLATGCLGSPTATSSTTQDVQEAEDTATPADVPPSGDAPVAADTVAAKDVAPDVAAPKDTTVTPDVATPADVVQPADVPVAKDTAVTPDVVQPADVAADAGKPLPLPACAQGNCANCKTTCPNAAVCSPDKQTYYNDCDAICTLKLDKALDSTWTLQACPSCGQCSFADKPEPGFGTDPTAGYCATLASGAKVTVSMECEAKCLEGFVSVAPGACKSKCSQPTATGGAGCNFTKYLPVCAKEDGKTYASVCTMNACDVAGCYPIGSTTKSAGCVAKAMTKECDGECFDAAKTPSCTGGCDPVCAITKAGKGQPFRNACLAKAAGAAVASCDGISATAADVCSAQLYKGKGCCEDVDYAVLKPICAAQTVNGVESWITFRSASEYACLTAGQTGWTQQYQGPCICKCPNTSVPVCGEDGLTYMNDCQAKCYNPGTFTTKPGACK